MNLTNDELELIALYRQPTRRGTLAELERIPLEQAAEAMQDLLSDVCTHLRQMSNEAFNALNLDEVEEEMEEGEYGEVG